MVAEADNAAAAMAGLLMLLLTLLLLRIAAAVAAAWDCASRLALWSSMLGERERKEKEQDGTVGMEETNTLNADVTHI